MSTAIVPAKHLDLLLVTWKLRRHTCGRTGQFCLMSLAPMLPTDCSSTRWARSDAQRYGLAHASFRPMERGGISQLFERVNRREGRAEVLRTWGTGIRALRQEPRFALNTASAWQEQ